MMRGRVTRLPILEIPAHDPDRAARLFGEGSVTEAVLPHENRAVAQEIGHELRILEGGDGVGLGRGD